MAAPRTVGLAVAALTVTAAVRPVGAQCPDGSPPPCRPRPVRLADSLVAIVPFQTVGPSLAVYGEGIVYLLSANLDGAGGLTSVLPQRGIERAAGQRLGDPGALAALGRTLGAGTVVSGSIVSTGTDRVRLLVTGVESRSGRRNVSFALDGSESGLGSLVDSASLILLARLTRVPLPQVTGAGRLPRSIEALRLFLAGERSWRAGRFDEADGSYERAWEYDSTFALALYRRFVLRRLGAVRRPPAAGWLAAQAVALSDRLPQRERQLLHAARRGGDYLDSTDLAERLDFVTRYSDDAEGWWWLEDWYFHAGAIYGYPLRSVVEAGERAIANDSTWWMMYDHAIWAAGRAGDRATVERLLGAEERALGRSLPVFRAALRLRFASPDSARRLLPAVAASARDTLEDPLWFHLSLLDPRIEAIALLDGILRVTPERRRLRAELLAAQGRFEAARALTDSGRREDSLDLGLVTTRALIVLSGVEPPRPADDWVPAALRAVTARQGSSYLGLADLLRRLELHLGDSAAASQRVRALQNRPAATEAESALVALEARAIAARLALGRGDTAAAVHLLESVTRVADAGAPFLWGRQDLLDQYLLGTLYAARGEPARARAVLDRPDRGTAIGGGVLGLKLLLLADLDATVGDTAAARRHYADVVALWQDGDPVVQPHVQRARMALAQLQDR